MNTMEVGKKLVALCREGKATEAMKSLYHSNIKSVEAAAPPGGSRETTGLEGCLAKGKQWESMHEVHSAKAEGPFPHGDRFAVFFSYDVTQRQANKRFTMNEVAVYTVKDGKIVAEEFFYDM